MTLMANLATLRDLGSAYWVHKYDSNWMAKICVDRFAFFPTYLCSKYTNTQKRAPHKKHDSVSVEALAQAQGESGI